MGGLDMCAAIRRRRADGFSSTRLSPHVRNYIAVAVLNALCFAIGLTAVIVRLRAPDRRFLFQRTAQLYVPNAPLLSAAFLLIFALLCGSISILAIFAVYDLPVRAAARLISLLVPFPLFSVNLWTSFGPVYAAHLFPTETIVAKWPRLGPWTRFRPVVVNLVCWAVPLLFLTPAIGLSIVYAAVGGEADDAGALLVEMTADPDVSDEMGEWQEMRVVSLYGQTYTAYRTLWALWAFAFLIPCAIYVLYSFVMLPILLSEIQVLESLEDAHPAQVSPLYELDSPGLKTPSLNQAASRRDPLGMMHLATPDSAQSPFFDEKRSLSSRPNSADSDAVGSLSPVLPRRPPLRARLDSERRSKLNLNFRRSRHSKDFVWLADVQRLTRLELLRANTRLAVVETGVNTGFCVLLAGVALAKCIAAPQWLPDPARNSTQLLVSLYIDVAYAITLGLLLCTRGYNANRVAVSPALPQTTDAFVVDPTIAEAPQSYRSSIHHTNNGPPLSSMLTPLPSPRRSTFKPLPAADNADGDERDLDMFEALASGP